MGKITLVMMAGLPGTGKSALALEIGRILGWPVVDKDTFKSRLLANGLPEATAASLAYELAFEETKDLLAIQGISVILDTPLTYRVTLEHGRALADSVKADFRLIFCYCDAELRDSRMRERNGKASQPKGLEAPGGNPLVDYGYLPPDTLKLHTAQALDNLVKQALGYVQSSPR